MCSACVCCCSFYGMQLYAVSSSTAILHACTPCLPLCLTRISAQPPPQTHTRTRARVRHSPALAAHALDLQLCPARRWQLPLRLLWLCARPDVLQQLLHPAAQLAPVVEAQHVLQVGSHSTSRVERCSVCLLEVDGAAACLCHGATAGQSSCMVQHCLVMQAAMCPTWLAMSPAHIRMVVSVRRFRPCTNSR